jgi:hypothetical protein
MKKTTFLWGAIVILFLLNAATLFFVVFNRQAGHHPLRPPEGDRRFDEQVIRTLQLSPEQMDRFEVLKREHHRQMLALDEATAGPFGAYFSMLLSGNADSLQKDSLEQDIAGIYLEKVSLTYAHFEQLKAICTPEQQRRFEQLIPSLMQVITPDKKNRGRSEGEGINRRIKRKQTIQFIPYATTKPDEKRPYCRAVCNSGAGCTRMQERR